MFFVSEINAQAQWENHARRTARMVNLAWCLEAIAGPVMLLGLVATCVVLLLRRQIPNMPWWQPACFSLLALVLLGLLCAFLSRKKFETVDQAFIRMEAAMRLRSALSAARAGVCVWPPCPDQVHAGLRWNWLRSLYAPLSALLLLAAAVWIPMDRIIPPMAVPDQPQSWLATEGELNQLEQEQAVDQEYIEQVRKKIDELRSQDPQEWFSHSSMEATDTMRKQHREELKKLEGDLSRAAKALGSLEKNTKMSDGERARQANEFEQALDGIKKGAMKPNLGLLDQLKGLDPQQLEKALTPEQMQQLKDNLQKNADQLGEAGAGGEDWSDELNADGSHPGDKEGEGEGQDEGDVGEGEDQEGTGQGAPTRGPGHDPNLLGKGSKEFEDGKMQGLQAQDLSKALPGDLLELQDGEHDVEKSATQLSSGGATSATGRGGDRVWRDSLDPEEQKALKKFFE